MRLGNKKAHSTDFSTDRNIRLKRTAISPLSCSGSPIPRTPKRPELVPPHKILNDIYWIDSRVPVVDAILFGQTNDETYAIAAFSDYLTISVGR